MNCEVKINNKSYNLICLEPKIVKSDKIIFIDSIKPPKYRLWSFRYEFIKYYKAYNQRVQTYINNEIDVCPFCDYKDNENKIYYNLDNKLCWGSLTYHLMKAHNYEPKNKFIKFILSLSNIYFFKMELNDLILFDGLMNSGGRTKKFKYSQISQNKEIVEKKKEYIYSEYSGYLDIQCKNKNCKIENIEISNFRRPEPDIYMVNFYSNRLSNKQYIFHTHPPTPNAGSRIQTERIVYEFPSFDDINSFIDLKRDFKIEGELIFAPEGIYVLTSKDRKKQTPKLKFKEKREYMNVLNDAYYNYHKIDNEHDFYIKPAQDFKYIKAINKLLANYNIKVLYFPKELSYDYKWIYGKIYLPINIEKN